MIRIIPPGVTAAFFVILFAISVHAQEKMVEMMQQSNGVPSNAIEKYLFAHQLYAYGNANKDILSVLCAVGILSKVPVRPGSWTIKSEGTPQSNGKVLKVSPAPSLDQMIATAREMVGQNKVLLSLLDDIVASGSKGASPGAQTQKSTINAESEAYFDISFNPAGRATVLLTFPSGVDADLAVKDEFGTDICSESKASLSPDGQQSLRCDWVPAWKGTFRVYVENKSKSGFEYTVETN